MKEQEIFMSDFPLMTSHGTFIINGVERVIVLEASEFLTESSKGNRYFGAKLFQLRSLD